MFRRRHLLPNPDLPPACVCLWPPPDLCGLRAFASSSLSCFTLSLFCEKSSKTNPSFSYSSALLQILYFDKPVYINSLRTLLQNTGGGILSHKTSALISGILATRQSLLATIPFRITSFADPHPLTSIESHLCKKHGGRWSFSSIPRMGQQHPSVTVVRSLSGKPSWKWRRDSCQSAWKVK